MLLKPKYDLSVVIPTGDDDRLALGLEGWLTQTDRYFDIHLVNDGGSDRVRATAQRYRDRGLIIHHHDLPGGGYRPSSARNLGIRHAEFAKRIILSDADVIPVPEVVALHRSYDCRKVYVLGMRRCIPRVIAEQMILPQHRLGRFDPGRIGAYPWLRDQRLRDPMFRGMFRHLLAGTLPTERDIKSFGEWFGVALDDLPGNLWQALLCWSFNVSYSGLGRRFDPGFDRGYGCEDLEFGLRMVADGYRVAVNRRIVVYHLDHQSRAPDTAKQQTVFKASLRRLRESCP